MEVGRSVAAASTEDMICCVGEGTVGICRWGRSVCSSLIVPGKKLSCTTCCPVTRLAVSSLARSPSSIEDLSVSSGLFWAGGTIWQSHLDAFQSQQEFQSF